MMPRLRTTASVLACAVSVAAAGGGAARAHDAAVPSAVCDPVTGKDAEAIYADARAAWAATTAAYPSAISYRIDVTVERGGRARTVRYAGREEPRLRRFAVARFSDEERAAPVPPTGIDVVLKLDLVYGLGSGGREIKLTNPLPTYDALGTPRLAITYAFGLRPAPNDAEPTAVASSAGGLATIGRAVVVRRDYEVSCVGVEEEPGGAVDHLRLRPLRAPERFRLREIWVDRGSAATIRIVTHGNFASGPPLGADWSIAFAREGAAQYIASETALQPLDFGKGRRFDRVVLRFVRDAAPAGAPPVVLRSPASGGDVVEPEP